MDLKLIKWPVIGKACRCPEDFLEHLFCDIRGLPINFLFFKSFTLCNLVAEERSDEETKLYKVEYNASLNDVWAVYQLKGVPASGNKRWEQYTVLRGTLGSKFYSIEMAVKDVLDSVVRASSLVENINSRIRNYFTLRKHLGNSYLEILRFFLNHRRFNASERAERVGKSPAELLTGTSHKHWLELLGCDLFKRAASKF